MVGPARWPYFRRKLMKTANSAEKDHNKAERNRTLMIPLRALSRVRVTCRTCTTVVEFQLTKDNLEKSSSGAYCPNCTANSQNPNNPTRFGVKFDAAWTHLTPLLGLLDEVEPEVAFIIDDPTSGNDPISQRSLFPQG
jgi:hypothetical protein